MKLAAIYNVWDGEEHLKKSIEYILPYVDSIIIVSQNVSNFGEVYTPNLVTVSEIDSDKISYHLFSPDGRKDDDAGYRNELAKRTVGLALAKQTGADHFLLLDTDEFYPDFKELKAEYIESGCDGSVCNIETYIAKEEYRLAPITPYKVPFIHKLDKSTVLGGSYQYRCDRTRTVRSVCVALLSKPMHHMSWVRVDIDRKLRNSSAKLTRRNDLVKAEIQELLDNGPKGFKSKYFHGRYIEVN